MHKIHDVDALLLLATTLASKRRPAELVEIVAAIDLLQGNIPSEDKLSEAFPRLAARGMICAAEGGFALTPAAQEIMAGQPKKGELAERLFGIKDELSTQAPKDENVPLAVPVADIKAAILAHRESGKGAGKNLLMPKPKVTEQDKPRPGQRQRKPMPKKRRRA
ncbi:MAG TPA: hypothetical protein VJ548_05440 [Azospira sp.]|nr:hypothetical protein [Azospira sp.]